MKAKLLIVCFLLFTISINGQKIPITTASQSALEFYTKGWELENKLELDAAEQFYRKAVEEDSTFALAYIRLGMVKNNFDFRLIQFRKALENLHKVSEGEKYWIMGRADFYVPEFKDAEEYASFKKLVELYPYDEMAQFLFGYVNIYHGVLKPDLAIKHLNNAIALNDKFILPYNPLIYAYLENDNYDEAQRIAKEQIEIVPNKVPPLEIYAETFLRIGEYEKSIMHYEKVLEIDPKYSWAIMGIAANLNFLNQHPEGREYINRLNEEQLNDYEYRHKWRALVCSYLDEGDFEGATATLEAQKQVTITGLNKRETTFHTYFSFMRKTRLYFENNQPEKGLEEYNAWKEHTLSYSNNERVISLVNNYEMYYKAFYSFCNGKYLEAENYLLEYKTIVRTENDASKTLQARIFLEMKEFNKAETILNTTDLNDPYNQYWLMITYFKSGKINEANRLRTEILNLNERNNINLALVRKRTNAIEL